MFNDRPDRLLNTYKDRVTLEDRADRIEELAEELKDEIDRTVITETQSSSKPAKRISTAMNRVFNAMLVFAWENMTPKGKERMYAWDMVKAYQTLYEVLQDRFGGYNAADTASTITNEFSNLKQQRDALVEEKEELQAQLEEARVERDAAKLYANKASQYLTEGQRRKCAGLNEVPAELDPEDIWEQSQDGFRVNA